MRKAKDASEKERRKIREQAKKKGRMPDARSLKAADYVFLITTLPLEAAMSQELLQLYRFRWQIELVFKRLKSILKLNELHSCCDALLNTVLLNRILAALIVEELIIGTGAFSPGDIDCLHPVSIDAAYRAIILAPRISVLGMVSLKD